MSHQAHVVFISFNPYTWAAARQKDLPNLSQRSFLCLPEEAGRVSRGK